MFNSSEHRKLNSEGIQSLQAILNNYTLPKSTTCRFNFCDGHSTSIRIIKNNLVIGV